MNTQQIVDELQVVRCEYIISAYRHGRYEIEVYNHVKDAVDAVVRLREGLLCIDEVRLELIVKRRGITASGYYQFSPTQFGRLEAAEAEAIALIHAEIVQSLSETVSSESGTLRKVPAQHCAALF